MQNSGFGNLKEMSQSMRQILMGEGDGGKRVSMLSNYADISRKDYV